MRYATLILAILLLPAAIAFAQETQPVLLPVPHSEPQNLADIALHKKYSAEFKDHSPQGELALAKTLRDDSAHEDDPAMKFVELREARDLAVYGGNFSDSFIAIDTIAGAFDINSHDMKSSALALGMDASRVPPPQLIESYITIANDELVNHEVELASKAMLVAWMIAHNSGDRGLVDRVKQASVPIDAAKREQTRFFNSARSLHYHPDDPALNLAVGSYLCGQMEQWPAGLPFLAKSGTPKLADAAALDRSEPTDAEKMADVGDAWWAVADADAINPAAARKRAAFWYAKAEPNLTGERKKSADDRIAFAKK